MINLAVISLKDFINCIKRILIGIILLVFLIKVLGNIKKGNYVEIEDLKEKSFFDYYETIDKTITISRYYNTKKNLNRSGIKKILVSELKILDIEKELMEMENQEEIIEFETKIDEDVSKEIFTEEIIQPEEIENEIKNDNFPIESTSIIAENNKKDTYTDIYKSVKIKNESKYQLTEEIVTPDFNLSNLKDIIIYHTHTCESYTPTDQNNYEASGNFRTINLNYNVSRVGEELKKYLINSFNVNHNVTYHDYPAYSGSYTRSLATIKSIIPNDYSRISD